MNRKTGDAETRLVAYVQLHDVAGHELARGELRDLGAG
jgi:hypothetical protein